MRLRLAILLTAIAGAPFAQAADQPCRPTTPKGSQQRTQLKHRAPVTTAPTKTSVAEVIGWKLPALNDPAVKRSSDPIDPRERKVFTLRGDIWIAKTEGNDCDYHVEMSAPGGSEDDPRIIVEIPRESKDVRKALIKALKDAGQGDLASHEELKISKSVPVTVTGFGFIDGYHWSKKQPKIGNHHGSANVATLWELHPIFDLTAR
jgi:hypothetical protein